MEKGLNRKTLTKFSILSLPPRPAKEQVRLRIATYSESFGRYFGRSEAKKGRHFFYLPVKR
jgi:hypothetical protein